MDAAPSSAPASSGAVRRLRRELESLREAQLQQVTVRPSESNLLEWHFALHSLPEDTPYAGGCFHGRLLFPPEYPHAPPAVVMVTPSGRLQTGCRLCLSMTDFHPESWSPAWSVETMLVGLISFFLSDAETGYGAVHDSSAHRRVLARTSNATNARNREFVALFPELLAIASDEHPAEAEAHFTSAHGGGDEEAPDDPAECWICRESTPEPLVHPCACRGSMSGVHASCVERWMQHRRRHSAGAAEQPRCAVCREPYLGQDVRPGLLSFVRHLLLTLAQQLGRSACLVLLLAGFQEVSAGPESVLPPTARAAVAAVFGLVAMHKFLVLACSLPLHRPPPRNRLARRLHVADPQELAKDVAEVFTVACVVAFWWASGDVAWQLALPFTLAAAWLALRLFEQQPSLRGIAQLARGLARCLVLPVAFSASLFSRLWQSPLRLLRWLHPLGPGLHIIVACVALGCCLLCASNATLVVIWTLHTLLLAALLLQPRPWRRGPLWWQVAQLSALCLYVANGLCDFPCGFGAPRWSGAWVLVSSWVWFATVCAVTALANWALCLQHYQSWQRRHGVFTLGSAPRERVVPVQAPWEP